MDQVFLQALLQNITPADLTNFAREVPQRADFLLTQVGTGILPMRNINNVKYRTRNQSIRVAAAQYRAYNAPTPSIYADASRSVTEGYLPPLGGKSAIEEWDIILDEIARGADTERLEEGLYDNVQNQVTAIFSRLELAAGDLLTDGILTIDENGILQDADFGVPVGNKPTAAILWTAANATPLTDERNWMNAQTDAGKPRPARALTSTRVASLLASNTEYRNAYWGGQVTGVTRQPLTPTQVQQVRDQFELPPITVYDTRVAVADPATGVITEQRTIPDHLFILLPPSTSGDLGETLLGRTAAATVLSTGSNPQIIRQDAPGLVSSAETTWDPVSVNTKTDAIGMPILHGPDTLVIASVVAPAV